MRLITHLSKSRHSSNPSDPPELQPAEHLWLLSDELIANRHPDDLDDLENRLCVQCERLMLDPGRVKAHILFHWRPRTRV